MSYALVPACVLLVAIMVMVAARDPAPVPT